MGLISRVSSRTYRMSNLLSSGKLLKNRLKQVISQKLFNCFTAIGNAPHASSQTMICMQNSRNFNNNQVSLLSQKHLPKTLLNNNQQPTSNFHTSAAALGRLGGGGHVKKRTATRAKQRRNHIMTRKDYLKMNGARVHNRVPCPCGKKMMLKYHICDTCYQATKHQSEKMLYEYREKTGNTFLVDEVKLEWKDGVKKGTDGFEEQIDGMKKPDIKHDVVKTGKHKTIVKLEEKQPKGWSNVSLW